MMSIAHSHDTDSEDERGFENQNYESVDGEDEPTYSLGRKMVTQGGRDTEYNTLVRSGDHGDKMQFESDSLHRKGSYSKLLMSQQSWIYKTYKVYLNKHCQCDKINVC